MICTTPSFTDSLIEVYRSTTPRRQAFADAMVEAYAARRGAKDSPGQMGMFETVGTPGGVRRSAKRQQTMDWEEHKHPRDNDGKFASGAGGGSSPKSNSTPKPSADDDDKPKNRPNTFVVRRSFNVKRDSFFQFLKVDRDSGKIVGAWEIDHHPDVDYVSAGSLTGEDRKIYRNTVNTIPKSGHDEFGVNQEAVAGTIETTNQFDYLPESHPVHRLLKANGPAVSEDRLLNLLPSTTGRGVFASQLTADGRQTAIDDVTYSLGREFLGTTKGRSSKIGNGSQFNKHYGSTALSSMPINSLVEIAGQGKTSVYRKSGPGEWIMAASEKVQSMMLSKTGSSINILPEFQRLLSNDSLSDTVFKRRCSTNRNTPVTKKADSSKQKK